MARSRNNQIMPVFSLVRVCRQIFLNSSLIFFQRYVLLA